MQNENAIVGSLLGTAVGDALGLPLEGLAPQRARKLFGEIGDDFGMRLCFGRGLVSDDTEHAILVLQAAAFAKGDVEKFQKKLARRLKIWFAFLPMTFARNIVLLFIVLLHGLRRFLPPY